MKQRKFVKEEKKSERRKKISERKKSVIKRQVKNLTSLKKVFWLIFLSILQQFDGENNEVKENL